MAKKGQYTYEYPHPAVTADCVVFGYDGKELRVLLIKRGYEKEASSTAYVGEWALPGGFLDVEKDLISWRPILTVWIVDDTVCYRSLNSEPVFHISQ